MLYSNIPIDYTEKEEQGKSSQQYTIKWIKTDVLMSKSPKIVKLRTYWDIHV